MGEGEEEIYEGKRNKAKRGEGGRKGADLRKNGKEGKKATKGRKEKEHNRNTIGGTRKQ